MFPSTPQQANAQGWSRQLDGSYAYPGVNLTNVPGKRRTVAQPVQGGQPGGSAVQAPRQPGTEGQAPQAPAPAKGSVSYQTGINPNRQAINSSDVLGRAGKEARMAGGTGAAADFTRGQIANDRAQLQRGISLENAQQNMVEQANRSEMFQAGLSMQADMMNKMAQLRATQVGMAADMMQNLMRSRGALMNSLVADSASRGGG
jgi:hypothetical protein